MKRVIAFVMLVLIVAFTSACGPSKAERDAKTKADWLVKQTNARTEALAIYADLRNSPVTGDTKSVFRANLVRKLNGADLALKDIGVKPEELDRLVAEAYERQAKDNLALLQASVKRAVGDPVYADARRQEFLRTQKLSGKPLSSFGVANEAVLGWYVGMNDLAAAGKRGTAFTSKDLREAKIHIVGSAVKHAPKAAVKAHRPATKEPVAKKPGWDAVRKSLTKKTPHKR